MMMNESMIETDENVKVSKNLESMLVYYTKDIGESEQEAYLRELLEELREELQNSFSKVMKNIYNPRVDIQQRMDLSRSLGSSCSTGCG